MPWCKRWKYRNRRANMALYDSIIQEDDETSGKLARNANILQINNEIEVLLGCNRREWCNSSGSGENDAEDASEASKFRTNMALAKHSSMANSDDANDAAKAQEGALPPVYVSDEAAPADTLKNGFFCTVNVLKKNMVKGFQVASSVC